MPESTFPAVLGLPRPGEPRPTRVPTPLRALLPNGLRLVMVPRAGLPQIALRMVVPGGAAADPRGFPGTAALVSSLLTEGTASFSAEELNWRLDDLGASLGAQAGHDFAEVDLAILAETLEPAIALFAETVARPTFPERETERVRAEALDALVARLDEPGNIADDRAAEAVFGTEHPYGRPTGGTTAGVAAVPREALARFHADHYRPDGSILVVAGDFDAEALSAVVEREFGRWTGAVAADPAVAAVDVPRAAGSRVDVDWPDAAQAEIRLAGVGLRRTAPEWIPAAVANYLLGGSTITGRLGANLREDKGWTYGVRSGFAAAVQPGGWGIETAVGAEVGDRAVAEIEAELDRFLQGPIGPEELERARHALILSLPRAFETPGRIVGRFAALEAFGLPADYWDRFGERVQAVTAQDVLRVARACFDPAALVRVVVAPTAGNSGSVGTGGNGR